MASGAQRSYASDVSLSFLSLMNLICDVIPARQADDSTKFVTICPDCDAPGVEPTRLSQRYICLDHDPLAEVRTAVDVALSDSSIKSVPKLREAVTAAVDKGVLAAHGPFTVAEAARAKEISKVLYRVTAEEIAEVKDTDLPEKQAEVEVYPSEQIERATMPSGSIYRLRPKGGLPVYAMLLDLLADTSKAFITELNLRGSQKLYRVSVETDADGNRQMVLHELIRPGDLAPFDTLNLPEYDGRLLDRAAQLVDTQLGDFDASKFENAVKARAVALAEAKRDPNLEPAPKAKKAKPEDTGGDELLALLEAAVAETTTKKKAS